MLSVRNGLLVVGCVFVGFVTSAGPGLVARAAEPPRWAAGVIARAGGGAVTDAAEAQQRISQLEQRLKELEAQAAGASPGVPASGAAVRELEGVIAQNRELAARNRELAAENQALVQSRLFEVPAPAKACAAPSVANPRAQIRYWVERLRDGDGGARGRLSTEQSAAVQVLLRPERELDPHNPWRELDGTPWRGISSGARLASAK